MACHKSPPTSSASIVPHVPHLKKQRKRKVPRPMADNQHALDPAPLKSRPSNQTSNTWQPSRPPRLRLSKRGLHVEILPSSLLVPSYFVSLILRLRRHFIFLLFHHIHRFYLSCTGGVSKPLSYAMAEEKYNLKNPAVKRILQEVKEMQSNPSDDFMSLPLEVYVFTGRSLTF